MATKTAEGIPPSEQTYPVIDPLAPCAWCGSRSRPRVQRGPSLLGYQCADAEACRTDWRRQHPGPRPRWMGRLQPKDMTGEVIL